MICSIFIGGLFHVGKHISTEIDRVVMASREGLWFPSIITQLCRRAEVPMGSDT